MMNFNLIIKVTTITLLMPGTVSFLAPYVILHRDGAIHWPLISGPTVLAIVTGCGSLAALLHCIRGFAVHGNGTLAPIAPPRTLVVRGLYRYTRNPMYLAVVGLLLSEALLFQNLSLLMYAGVVFLCFHLFVIGYEEPHLRSTFGTLYDEYAITVPRWRIAKRAFQPVKQSHNLQD